MQLLEKTFRWFGPDFGVTLQDIQQTGATGIVTALHHIPTGEVWSESEVSQRKVEIENTGLRWSVVESVNVHEQIKTDGPEARHFIDNYIETLHHLAANDIRTVCYNFMPVLDWTRTDLNFKLANGSTTLKYDDVALAAFDLYILQRPGASTEYDDEAKMTAKKYLEALDEEGRHKLQNTVMAGLPGTRDVISLDTFRDHLGRYAQIGPDELRENLVKFLSKVTPEAESLGINLCIHPDDPPKSLFGLPRVVSTAYDLKYLFDAVPSIHNGLTYCTGSLGAGRDNNLVEIFKVFADRVHFLHLRSVQHEDSSFHEAPHLGGSAPMAAIMSHIVAEQVKRSKAGRNDVAIPFRPDHGHLLLDDLARPNAFYPGYSTIGRLKGLAELSGLELGIRYQMGL